MPVSHTLTSAGSPNEHASSKVIARTPDPIPKPTFPERWGIRVDDGVAVGTTQRVEALQPTLF